MARCATVKADYPQSLFLESESFPLPEAIVDAATLGQGERELISRAHEEFRIDLQRQLETILLDLGADKDDIKSMSPSAMKLEIKRREDPEQLQSARRQIARERAGLEQPISPRTPTEKFEYLMGDLGNAYESKLARVLGEHRAAELRSIGDGWSARSVVGGECDPTDSAR